MYLNSDSYTSGVFRMLLIHSNRSLAKSAISDFSRVKKTSAEYPNENIRAPGNAAGRDFLSQLYPVSSSVHVAAYPPLSPWTAIKSMGYWFSEGTVFACDGSSSRCNPYSFFGIGVFGFCDLAMLLRATTWSWEASLLDVSISAVLAGTVTPWVACAIASSVDQVDSPFSDIVEGLLFRDEARNDFNSDFW